MEPDVFTRIVYTAHCFRSQPSSYALMVVVDGFEAPEDCEVFLSGLFPTNYLASPWQSPTVH
jgi:hypothetical protein